MNSNALSLPISLVIASVSLAIAANSQAIQDGQLVKPSWSGIGNLAAVGCLAGGVVSLKRTLSQSQPAAQSTMKPKSQPQPIQINPPVVIESFSTESSEEYIPIIKPLRTEETFTEVSLPNPPTGLPDLVDETAGYILDRDGSGILLSAVTDAGKTTLLHNLMATIKSATNDKAEFYVIDAKGSTWCGLENQKDSEGSDRVLIVNHPDKIKRIRLYEEAIALIERIEAIRAYRSQKRVETELNGQTFNPPPLVLICDEWLCFVAQLSKEQLSCVTTAMKNLAFMGREDRVHFILTGQSHKCGLTKIEAGARTNLGVIALAGSKGGKKPKCDAIESAISDHWLVNSPSVRINLAEQMEQLRNSGTERFYYSSINGHHMSVTPQLSKQSKLWRNVNTELSNVVAFRSKKNEEFPDPWLTTN